MEGNTHPAKIFLDTKNRDILDKELQENFGTNIRELHRQDAETEEVIVRLHKTELPKLEISRLVRRVVRKAAADTDIQLEIPTDAEETSPILRRILTPDFTRGGSTSPLTGIGEMDEVAGVDRPTDCYTLTQWLAANYHLSFMKTLETLEGLYPDRKIPEGHLNALYRQVEDQLQDYETVEEEVTDALALIHVHDDEGKPLFETDTDGHYIHRLRLLKRTADRMRENRLLFDSEDLPDTSDISFHYAPYNFDTKPEREFFETLLATLNLAAADVKTFLFTGGLTDTNKTDFHFEYKGTDGNYHRYFPDFVIVKHTGEFYIVEIKSEKERKDPTVKAKRKAVERLERLQPDARFTYRVIYATGDGIGMQENADLSAVIAWIRNEDTLQTNGY